MTPEESLYVAAAQGVLIVNPDGLDRHAIALLEADSGIVWVAPGWYEWHNSTHPMHFLEGRVEADGDGWRIGGARIRKADMGMQNVYNLWLDWRIANLTGGITQDLMVEKARASLADTTIRMPKVPDYVDSPE